MTEFVSLMWSVWGAMVLAAAALYVYRLRLTRDEDDQLILDDSFDNVKAQQAAIVASIHKVEPFFRTTIWLAVAMSVVVIAYYILDILNQFK